LLHNPYEGTTPSQRQAAVAHRERLFRLSAPAIKLRDAVAPTVDDITADILEKRWADEQKRPWFEIISEKAAPGSVIRIDDVLRVCCKYFDLTSNQIKSERRTAPVVYARQIAMYLCKYLTTKSYPEIGRRLGGRDHTTVLHGHRKVESLLPKDWLLAYDVAHVEAML
jgi:chromosomal replication initiation ATPase DnaA